ncbi:MAG: hypothetical protein KF878_08660 [Planctomycetes bacterium]|nr:hypothetical protein [Planctomycetota bacterium]
MRIGWTLALGLLVVGPGCIGSIRETTSPRTATEMLLVSTAALRAVRLFDAAPLDGQRVYLDLTNFESIDKGYVQSALRDHLSGAGAILVDQIDPEGDRPGADVVVEVRNGALGIYDGTFTLGVPSLPITVPGLTTALVSPPLYIFRRDTSQGWAKFQLWTYDRRTRRYISRSPELWGASYYNQWYWFGVGPFDGSNDIYPDWDYEALFPDEVPRARPHGPPPPPGAGEPPQPGADAPPVPGEREGAPRGDPARDTGAPPRESPPRE